MLQQETPASPPRPQVPRPFFPNLTLIVHAQSQKCRQLQQEFPQLPKLVNISVVDATLLPRNSTGMKVPTIVNAMADMFDKVNIARTGLKKVAAFLRDVQEKYLRATNQLATASATPRPNAASACTTPAATHVRGKDGGAAGSCGGGADKTDDDAGNCNSGFVQQGDAIVMSPERLRAINEEIKRDLENAAKAPLSRSPPQQPKEPTAIPYNGGS